MIDWLIDWSIALLTLGNAVSSQLLRSTPTSTLEVVLWQQRPLNVRPVVQNVVLNVVNDALLGGRLWQYDGAQTFSATTDDTKTASDTRMMVPYILNAFTNPLRKRYTSLCTLPTSPGLNKMGGVLRGTGGWWGQWFGGQSKHMEDSWIVLK